jgi:hypothetical protein
MVCPTPESRSFFSIVGAVGTHYSDFEETKETHNDGNPDCQRPASICKHSGSAYKKARKDDEKKMS